MGTGRGRYETLGANIVCTKISCDARKLLFTGRQILFFIFFCGILGPSETTPLIFRLPFAVDGYADHMVRTRWIFMKVQTLVFLFWDPSEPLPANVYILFFLFFSIFFFFFFLFHFFFFSRPRTMRRVEHCNSENGATCTFLCNLCSNLNPCVEVLWKSSRLSAMKI